MSTSPSTGRLQGRGQRPLRRQGRKACRGSRPRRVRERPSDHRGALDEWGVEPLPGGGKTVVGTGVVEPSPAPCSSTAMTAPDSDWEQGLSCLEQRLQSAQTRTFPAGPRDTLRGLRRTLELVVGDRQHADAAVTLFDLPGDPARGFLRHLGVVEGLPTVGEGLCGRSASKTSASPRCFPSGPCDVTRLPRTSMAAPWK